VLDKKGKKEVANDEAEEKIHKKGGD